jgi:cobyric acid synthase
VFESPAVRSELAATAGLSYYRAAQGSWRSHLERVYHRMADALEQYLELGEIWKYVAV